MDVLTQRQVRGLALLSGSWGSRVVVRNGSRRSGMDLRNGSRGSGMGGGRRASLGGGHTDHPGSRRDILLRQKGRQLYVYRLSLLFVIVNGMIDPPPFLLFLALVFVLVFFLSLAVTEIITCDRNTLWILTVFHAKVLVCVLVFHSVSVATSADYKQHLTVIPPVKSLANSCWLMFWGLVSKVYM